MSVSQVASPASSPLVFAYKLNLVPMYTSSALGVATTVFPSQAVWTSSVISIGPFGLTKTFGVFISGSSAFQNMGGNNTLNYYIDYSFDGIGWHGYDTGSITGSMGCTGSFTMVNKWNYTYFTGSVPYVRLLIYNTSGSAVTGSVVLFSSTFLQT